MRFLFVGFGCLFAAAAHSDRLITIPIGRKLPTRDVRFEFQSESGHARFTRYYFAGGINRQLDAEIRVERLVGGNAIGTIDLAYNLQPPITDLSPGFSVGVLDAMNRTVHGREAYAAITVRQGLAVEATNLFADATIGVRAGRKQVAFVGISLPFSEQIRLLAEHDGFELRAGFEFRPVKPLGLRVVFEQGRTTLSMQASHRF